MQPNHYEVIIIVQHESVFYQI